MKTKIYKIMGVALAIVLLASLTVGLAIPASGAVTSNLKFTKLVLPQVEDWFGAGTEAAFADSEGDYWATPFIDVGPIAKTPDGEILFASAYPDGGGFYEVLKSLDGGYAWTATGFYDEAFLTGDGSAIVDIVTSPEYTDDTTLVVATQNFVYISDDGGKNFVNIPDPAATINDLDVTITEGGDLAIMVCDIAGELYVKKGLLNWIPQELDVYAGSALACAFLPTFAADGDIGICAVKNDGTVNNTTIMTFSFNSINTPGPAGGWNISGIVDAPFQEADSGDFYSAFARIAFPEDFDSFGVGNNVCFVGISSTTGLGAATLPEDNGDDAYKVVLKEAGTSQTVDLDVRGVLTTLLPTATAITSIEVCGPADAATLLVGTDTCNLADTPTYFFVYSSDDSGATWVPSTKQPTGGTPVDYGADGSGITFLNARTAMLMAPDYCAGSTAYASTRDNGGAYGTSAFQRTTDSATSWNQISIIDYARINDDYYATEYGFMPAGYSVDGTIRMITSESPAVGASTNGAVWQRIGGKHWERILSYANAGVTSGLFQLSAPMDGSAIFASDLNFGGAGNDCMWRSTDGGATWPKKINTKDGLTWVSAVSATTLYTGHVAALANGSGIWWTTKSGTGWNKPDDTEMSGTAVVVSVSAAGDIVHAATYDGQVFISSDGGDTVEKVGRNDPGFPGPAPYVTLEGLDLSFAANGIMYVTAAGNFAGPSGIWRTSVDLSNPGDCTWEQIDDNQDSTGLPVEYKRGHRGPHVTANSPAAQRCALCR